MSNSEPLVSIITPVYNGEKYLAECIESVLNQSYKNWDYCIVNNCSTDKTREIAEEYARKDPRIRVHNNSAFLNIYDNLNHAMRQLAPGSKYCKVVHADDLLFPECVEKMVQLAERHPEIGIVGAYGLRGKEVVWDRLIPLGSPVIPGRNVCRSILLGEPYVFGSPTSTLIRADLVRKKADFYNVINPNPDAEVCFELLKESDFGFVHQVLTYTRVHEESQTTKDSKVGSLVFGKLVTLQKFGPVYLTKDEFEERVDRWRLWFSVCCAKYLLEGRLISFLKYNLPRMKQIGFKLSVLSCIKAVIKGLRHIRFSVGNGAICLSYRKMLF
ncbi:MAG: glycosyltransferase family 2 protein [Bacillota bacterium]|jgi:glycosyltransferase involved in cell wall biosynthesis|nr:glycosyltransferase family 2 protein [Clostridia bacterium]